MEALDFEGWYRREHPVLLASMVLVSGQPELAREAVDEALTRALERWERVSAMSSPGGWTYKVALHCLRRRSRRAALERRLLGRLHRHGAVAPPAGEAWEVVRSLPARQRAVVVLRYVADLSQAEIAEVLGITRSTVSSTLTDAHRALAPLLGDPPEEADT
ncbi:MAG TPA: sigma-70 family RNA polymerase sigma factor [Acidimicrobiales bacterium]|nr:sigma-70 family RNA polymerase sigma factor [Acidimicrobiales bacterium]